MTRRRFWALISTAIALMAAAIVLPFLMVLRVIAPNVPLSFFSYAMSVGGLGISLYAFVHHSGLRAGKRGHESRNDSGDA